jgi:hypothetical protein
MVIIVAITGELIISIIRDAAIKQIVAKEFFLIFIAPFGYVQRAIPAEQLG